MDPWHCPNCRYSNNPAHYRYCKNCNFNRGHWECQNCHYPKNFNENQTCYKCSAPRIHHHQYTFSRDSKKGWICPCGFHNYNDRTECFRCNKRWICSDKHCGSDNYGYRTHCFVCRRPKSNTSAYSRISNEESSSSRRPNDEVSSSRRPNEEHSSSRNKSEKYALKDKEGNATTERLITGDGEKLQITLTNTTPSSKSTDGKSSRNSSDEIGTKSRRHTLTQEIKRRVNSGDKTNRRRRLSAEDTKRRRDKSGVATRSHSHDSKRRRHNSDNTDLREKIDKAKLEDLKNLSKKLESNKSGKRQMKNSVEREGKRSRECTRSQERATSKRGFLKDEDKEFGFDSLSRNESPCKSSFMYNFNPNKLPPGPCVLPPLPPRPKPIPHNRTTSDDKESAISTAETTSQTTRCYQDTISHDTDITDVTTKYLSIAKEISTTNAFETEEVHSVFKVLQQLHGESKSYDENKTITKDDIYEPEEMDVDEKMRKRKDGAKDMDNAKKRKHDSIEPLEEETKPGN